MSRTAKTTADYGALPKNWADLNALLPLRPIRDDVDYDNAAELLDRLAVLEARTDDQEDYLDTLTVLVERHDDMHFSIDASATPLGALAYLCEENGMNASALGSLLGNRALGSKLLRGERELSKEHIRKLCEHFAVGSDLFL